MRIQRTLMATGAVLAMVLAGPAGAVSAGPSSGGCKAFGANVATLATTFGPLFGATASSVASSAPQALPTLVVHQEQATFCG